MTETSCFPESFDEVVQLVIQGQMEAAGIIWDHTIISAIESEREEPSGFCPGKD